ncbi:snRNA-activating protein complex subunit [Thalictrum thalictroides]|uniref:snRNA-activating protein complex subunit n=1 Tax=Thalictrum thalictroides TaxID=46969 RepID=A0A7J6X0H1_THATH|nr:snRNA-activating protein complex subunit [Thalictrum thalictroides]
MVTLDFTSLQMSFKMKENMVVLKGIQEAAELSFWVLMLLTNFARSILTVVGALYSLADSTIESNEEHEEELSIDELKVFSEEELVDKALKEAFDIQTQHQQQPLEENNLGDKKELVLDKKELKKLKKGKKRGRTFDRDTRAAELENTSYIEKIEKLAEIKRKQDEDKIVARLHSFNGGLKVSDGLVAVSSTSESENIAKMASLRFTTSSRKVKIGGNVGEYVGVSCPEVVLCVEIYNMSKIWVKNQELLVLGSQMLSELKDNICCLTDQLMQKAGKYDPSGYFLIEDVFCNDKRDPSAIDYSEPILHWLRNSKVEVREKWECILSGELQQKQRALFGQNTTLNLPHFKTVEMHKIRFCDLWFRLGAGYLYCHHGDCKHIIVIRDMRLIHPEDVQNRAAYPLLTFQHKSRYPKCSACKIYRATKVTLDDKWSQENPCYFCDNCYQIFHYKEDESL